MPLASGAAFFPRGARARDTGAGGGPSAPGDPASAERRLVEESQRGNRQAFAQLVDAHQGAVYAYLRARLLEPADAEDLTQETFLRCFVRRERFGQAPSVRAWLLGIARNCLREHVKRLARRREVAWTELCLELDELVSDSPAESDAARRHLPACLEGLGESAREALRLRYQESLKLVEVARRLDRSDGAVRLLVFRARQALRHCLDTKLRADRHG